MIEKIYYSADEYITLDIPENGTIGCSISGGTDSSLLCYLLAHTIKKHGLKTKIHPITGELLKRPYNLRHSYDAISTVSRLTGFQFELHLSFFVPNHGDNILTDEQKDRIHSRYFMEFMDRFGALPIFHGNTSNPPIEKLPDTDYAERPRSRDNPAWRQAQVSNPDLRAPFIFVDKKVIGALYKKYDLLETLFPVTRSCEAELEQTAYFTKDCFEARPGQECWWCLERAYGFNDFLNKEKPLDRKDLLY